MKEPLIFVSVSVEKELPKEDGAYFTILKGALIGQWYAIDKNDPLEHGWDNYPDIWLKPLSLPELMEEFETKREGYLNQGHSIKSALNEFYKEKGIL